MTIGSARAREGRHKRLHPKSHTLLEEPKVCFGSFASVWPDHGDFRSTPVNGHSQDRRACLKGAAKSRLRQTTNGSEPNASPDQSPSLPGTHVRLKNGSARPVLTEIGEPGFARNHEHQIARGWPQRRGQRYSSTLTDPQGLKVWSERPCKHPSCFWA